MKITVGIEKAVQLAKESGLESLVASVQKAAGDGWDAVNLIAEPDGDGGWDIGVTEPSGVMVALFLPDWVAEDLAIPGGEPATDLHVTLAYLGDAANLSLDDQRKLIGVVGEVCLSSTELQGTFEGVGKFSNGEDTDPYWVGVNFPGIQDLRAKLVTALTDAGFQLAGFSAGKAEYTPHVTVAYLPKGQELPPLDFMPVDAELRKITVCVGSKRFELSLQKDQDADDNMVAPPSRGWAPQAMTKAIETVEEDRFTLAPWYIPDQLDAHNEWSDARELEKSFHNYLSKPDRDIRLQHNTDIVAGHWVSGMVVPTPYTVTLTKADGSTTDHTYPAGTPFLGVEWKPWAFELVKKGLIRGYSIGGKSQRLLVDLPEK